MTEVDIERCIQLIGAAGLVILFFVRSVMSVLGPGAGSVLVPVLSAAVMGVVRPAVIFVGIEDQGAADETDVFRFRSINSRKAVYG